MNSGADIFSRESTKVDGNDEAPETADAGKGTDAVASRSSDGSSCWTLKGALATLLLSESFALGAIIGATARNKVP